MRKKNITISDIAARTGYSKTTVSFAFNWPNRISAAAVEKILTCASELGYHGSGDSESSNRYKTICVLVPDIAGDDPVPLWAGSVYAIYKICSARGFMLSLINQNRMDDPFFTKTSAVDAFMVFSGENVSELLRENARRRGIPIISVNISRDLSEEQRGANSIACLNMLIDLVKDGSFTVEAPAGAYLLFDANR